MTILRPIRAYLTLPAALLIVLLQGCFETGPVDFISWRVLLSTASAITLEVQLDGREIKEPLFIRAFAKSGDRVVTRLAIPSVITSGLGARLVTIVAPVDPGAFQMDSILFEWFDERGTVVGQKIVKYDYAWASRRDTLLVALSLRENDDAGFQMFFESALTPTNYPVIDQVFAAYPDAAERDPSGGNPQSSFRAAAALMVDIDKNYGHTIEQWRSVAPHSPAGVIAEVVGLEEQALFSKSGPEVAGPVGMMRADKVLDESKSFAGVTPLWYREKLSIAIFLGRDPATVGAIFKEAVERFPQFRDLYTTMVVYDVVDTGKVNWARTKYLVGLAGINTKPADGDSAYADLYANLGKYIEDPRDLFVVGGVDWRIMRASFEDLVARYPSNINFNRYAAFACVAGDKETFLRVTSRLGPHINARAWPHNHSPDLCEHRFLTPA